MLFNHKTYALSCTLVLCLAFIIYYPGLYGDFEFDDTVNIIENDSLQLTSLSFSELQQAALSGRSGQLLRPIPMITFALNFLSTDKDPFYFKLTNLVIHIAVGITLLFLTILLLDSYRRSFQPRLTALHVRWIALLVTAAWMFHPLNLTAVLYVVQRMTSLATLFMVLALVMYMLLRERWRHSGKPATIYLLGVVLFSGLALLSKEIAIILPGYMLVIEVFLLRFKTASKLQQHFLIFLFFLFALTGAIGIIGVVFGYPESIYSAYHTREFDLVQRLLTESRVIWFYLGLIVFPDVAKMGIYHDDIAISTSLLDPITTLPSLLGLILLCIIPFIVKKRLPLVGLGISWFLVGHVLESTVLPLEIAHEHRNYLPDFGILLVLLYGFVNPLVIKSTLSLRSLGSIVLVSLLGFTTYSRASQWGDLTYHAIIEARYHPKSVRANYQVGRIYYMLYKKDSSSPELLNKAIKQLRSAVDLGGLSKGSVITLLQIRMMEKLDGQSALLSTIRHELASELNPPDTIHYLMGLVKCQKAGLCELNPRDMLSLFEAVRDNPTTPNRIVARTEYELAYYYAEVVGDPQQAYRSFRKAIALSPNELDYQIGFIYFLLAVEDAAEAQRYLEIVTHADTMNLYGPQLNSLRGQISKLRMDRQDAENMNDD